MKEQLKQRFFEPIQDNVNPFAQQLEYCHQLQLILACSHDTLLPISSRLIMLKNIFPYTDEDGSFGSRRLLEEVVTDYLSSALSSKLQYLNNIDKNIVEKIMSIIDEPRHKFEHVNFRDKELIQKLLHNSGAFININTDQSYENFLVEREELYFIT